MQCSKDVFCLDFKYSKTTGTCKLNETPQDDYQGNKDNLSAKKVCPLDPSLLIQFFLTGSLRIPDSSLKVSSELDANRLGAAHSRLNSQPERNVLSGSWTPKYNVKAWIQADLGTLTYVYMLATQERYSDNNIQYVTQLTLAFSFDGTIWNGYKSVEGVLKLFDGNDGSKDTKWHNLLVPTLARYVRLYPTQYFTRPSLRWDIVGCPLK